MENVDKPEQESPKKTDCQTNPKKRPTTTDLVASDVDAPPAKRQATTEPTNYEETPETVTIPANSSLPTVSETLTSDGNSTEMLRIRQAVCLMCCKDIPNLYDVVDNSVEDSDVPAAAAHRCEECMGPSVEEQRTEKFIFAGPVERQSSIEEVLVISDEESVVITLSSSDDDIIVASTPAPKGSKLKKRRKGSQERNKKIKETVQHPKYNLYKESSKENSIKSKRQAAANKSKVTKLTPTLSVDSSSDSDNDDLLHKNSTSEKPVDGIGTIKSEKVPQTNVEKTKKSLQKDDQEMRNKDEKNDIEKKETELSTKNIDEEVFKTDKNMLDDTVKETAKIDTKSKKSTDENKETELKVKQNDILDLDCKTKKIHEKEDDGIDNVIQRKNDDKNSSSESVDKYKDSINEDGATEEKMIDKETRAVDENTSANTSGDEVTSKQNNNGCKGSTDKKLDTKDEVSTNSESSEISNDDCTSAMNNILSSNEDETAGETTIQYSSKPFDEADPENEDDEFEVECIFQKESVEDSNDVLVEEEKIPKNIQAVEEGTSNVKRSLEGEVKKLRDEDNTFNEIATEMTSNDNVNSPLTVVETKSSSVVEALQDTEKDSEQLTNLANATVETGQNSQTKDIAKDSIGDNSNVISNYQSKNESETVLKEEKMIGPIAQLPDKMKVIEIRESGLEDDKHKEEVPLKTSGSKKKKKKQNKPHMQSMCNFLNDFNIKPDTESSVPKMIEEVVEKPSSKQQKDVPMEEQVESLASPTEVNSEIYENTLVQEPASPVHWDWLGKHQSPRLVTTCRHEYQTSYENYLRGCVWSPDGSLLITNSDDNILRIFQSPSFDEVIQDGTNAQDELKPSLRLSEGETVYDYSWYPYMTSQDHDTCCFLTTSRDHPIHLWDTNTGRIRCSYRAFDQMDELASAHSVSFNIDGSKIYAGFNNFVRVFDSARPGRDFVEKSTVPKKNRSRKDRHQASLNQRGIVSCIAFSNQYSGLYALGTFSKTVGLYAANDDEPLFLLKEHAGGITQLKFTDDGVYLFSGARKDGELIAWDMRNTSYPLFKMNRNVNTNQRIQFDIDETCQYLCSGNTNGDISVWNIRDIMLNVGNDVIKHDPSFTFCGHNDAVNGVSLHHSSKLLATTSGQRHFYVNDADSDNEKDNTVMETNQAQILYDNSLKIWSLG